MHTLLTACSALLPLPLLDMLTIPPPFSDHSTLVIVALDIASCSASSLAPFALHDSDHRCRKAKIKCNGKRKDAQNCTRCEAKGLECNWTASRRGKKPGTKK